MSMYSTVRSGGDEMIHRDNGDGSVSFIPTAPGNRDYQEYLEWLAEGNKALVIEEPTDG